ncbi:hypothetical protein GOBAR_DD22179 [Gossypium barbadense]|nr:hypothetical protein GOBAR_DD22179 [Gossypium barbadense]
MSNKVRDAQASAVDRSPRGTRPIPRRGQIKSRMAANAFNSIVSVLSRAAAAGPNHRHSHRKTYLREA